MFRSRRRSLSQNFFTNRTLVRELIRRSSIGEKDTVIDIGAGTGIISQELVRLARKVIAIEIDKHLLPILYRKLYLFPNLEIIHKNVLTYQLPHSSYKIFANIPFSIEGKLIRKIFNDENPPEDCYLVMRKEFAMRFAGLNKNTTLSMFYKPWFEHKVIYEFNEQDFTPPTKVKAVLLHTQKRKVPLLSSSFKTEYQKFIYDGFKDGKKVKDNLQNHFPNNYKLIAQKLNISLKAKPSKLQIHQWIDLFNVMNS